MTTSSIAVSHLLRSELPIIQEIMMSLLNGPIILPAPHNEPRLILAQVCSSWRQLILSTPSFWNRYIFTPSPFTRPDVELEMMHQFISRSTNYALSFFFTVGTLLSPGQAPGTVNLKDPNIDFSQLVYGLGKFSIVEQVLKPYAPRITVLRCLLQGTDISRFLFTIPAGQFRALRSIDIVLVNRTDSPAVQYPTSPINVFRNLPYLQHSAIHILTGIDPLRLQLPWNQLTRLDAGNTIVNTRCWLRILNACSSSLVYGHFYVQLRVNSQKIISKWMNRTIVLPRIETLRVRVMDIGVCPRFIQVVHAPGLRSLCIEAIDTNTGFLWDFTFYTSFLSMAGRRLSTLVLRYLGLNHPDCTDRSSVDINNIVCVDPSHRLGGKTRPQRTSYLLDFVSFHLVILVAHDILTRRRAALFPISLITPYM